ncbi:MAG TPA: universal stress protein [Burkholderiales bacterium]|nr:universal stress protein [Burkholderiales bacterium]
MYKRILVPVDGSGTSLTALRHAVVLAREQGAQLRLIYVVESVQAWATEGQVDLESVLRESGKAVLADAEATARRDGITPETGTVSAGMQRIARCIADDAAGWSADLIVMGTHGRRGIDHLILGSVAEGVVRIARSPVLLVRGE